MLFRLALLSSIFASASAGQVLGRAINDIPATSELGTKLLSKSRLLSNDNNQEGEMTWVAGYSLKFEGCRELFQYGNREGEGGEEGGGANPFNVQRLVEYRLCPSDNCTSGCQDGAVYVVGMAEFVMAYVEARREAQEEACEVVRENCYCNDDTDDEVCEAQCYANAGLDYCVRDEENGQEGEEDAERYAECTEIERRENGNNNNNNNRNNYYRYYRYSCYNEECNLYVGPYCSSDGSSIYLGSFIDETCTTAAPSGTYSAYNYGATLKYSEATGEPLVGDDCVSCNATRAEEEWNADREDEINELCQEIYEQAIKCEENLTIPYPDSSACYYITEILPQLDALYRAKSSYASAIYYSLVPIAVVGFAALSHRMYTKLQRQNVNLSDQEIMS